MSWHPDSIEWLYSILRVWLLLRYDHLEMASWNFILDTDGIQGFRWARLLTD